MDIMEPVPAGRRKISYEEFLTRCDDRNAAEWVDGEIIYLTVSVDHNNLNLWLVRIFGAFLESFPIGNLFADPFQMKTGPNLPGRAPDVCVLLNENLGRLQKNHIKGPADLVVEIISPDSIVRDRGEKFTEYEAGGVREYWIIDPLRKQAEFYLRGEDGYFHPTFPDDAGVYRCKALNGLWVSTAWFWRKPLPPLVEILRAWELI